MNYHLSEILGPVVLPLRSRVPSENIVNGYPTNAIKATKDKYVVTNRARKLISSINKSTRLTHTS